jgi:hypothetical protein
MKNITNRARGQKNARKLKTNPSESDNQENDVTSLKSRRRTYPSVVGSSNTTEYGLKVNGGRIESGRLSRDE